MGCSPCVTWKGDAKESCRFGRTPYTTLGPNMTAPSLHIIAVSKLASPFASVAVEKEKTGLWPSARPEVTSTQQIITERANFIANRASLSLHLPFAVLVPFFRSAGMAFDYRQFSLGGRTWASTRSISFAAAPCCRQTDPRGERPSFLARAWMQYAPLHRQSAN